ncbi:MAG: ABC transporter permease [Lachnospiraceae bacterium]
MVRFIGNKIVQYVAVLFITSIIIFGMVRLNPADPVAVIMGGKQSTEETIMNIRHEFYLDKSIPEQYLIWVTGVLHGDFGISFMYRQPVGNLIQERLPVTAGIVIIATLISVMISIPTGIITAVKQHSALDTGISVVQLILVAVPPFLTSILMIWIISKSAPGFSFTGSFTTLGQYLQRISLPAVALSFSMIALTSRVTKTSMIEQIQANYYIVSLSKGLSPNQVIIRHCLKNAIIPVITILGTQIGILIVGAVLVENVFSLAGLGSILIEGIKASDYPIVQGITMLMVLVFMTISTLLDILYGVIDPRIRLQ